MRRLIFVVVLLLFGIQCYAQEPNQYTLFVGEFENRTDIINPILDLLENLEPDNLFLAVHL